MFTGDDSTCILVGTRQGTLQLWDKRETGAAVSEVNLLTSTATQAGGSEAGAKKLETPTVASVMDIELSVDKKGALVTVGRKVNPSVLVYRIVI